MTKPVPTPLQRPIWDRGDPIDEEMLRFTIGDDWLQDRRLVSADLHGSLAHAAGLARVGLINAAEHDAIRRGLDGLLESYAAGDWDVEEGDEDVHSAVERRLVDLVGDAGKKLHTGRSRNDQVATDIRLWLRGAIEVCDAALDALDRALAERIERDGALPLPGYTHLRRAMPSTVADWLGAHRAALAADREDLALARRRASRCPLGSGAGYGVPLKLDREFVARELGFDGPEEPVTLTQHSRGRAELGLATAYESIALDLGKLASDLWLYTSSEFGFVKLPVDLSTGSSLMPHKRNPDLLELMRANARQVVAERAALLDVLRDLPSGYHRDFQLLKPPLFRAHDRIAAMLPLATKLVSRFDFDGTALDKAAADPSLHATARLLARAAAGEAFRDVYREESRKDA